MKKALLVIDMQNDYLWENRKKEFSYNTEKIINSVNDTIEKYKDICDVIYISHLIQNIITNRILFGFSIEGTKGAELYDKLNIVSNLKFNKYLKDAYRSKEFRNYMNNNKYEEVLLCGLDHCGCVYHTAIGALKSNTKVSIVSKACACRYSEAKYSKVKNRLIKMGVKYI